MAIVEFLWLLVCVAEVTLSILVHLCYGFLIFISAVIGDASAIIGQSSSSSKNADMVSQLLDSAREAAIPSSNSNRGNTHYEQFFQGHQEAPIVLVHGIFGFGKGKLGGLSYWGGAEDKDNQILLPDLGSLTSIHDRACELFYFLKGGTVDYGAEHSSRCCHARYGRTYAEGHYPMWGDDHPIHFVGHSSGAQVVRVLQQMLADKTFEGHGNTSADWILSLTSLSGALNGTTRSYIDGIRPGDGISIERVSLLQFLRVAVLIYEWLDIPALKSLYSFGFDHYHLTWHESGVQGLATAMVGKAGPFATGDWILPDLSLQGAIEINRPLKTHPNTYYISYATKRTRKFLGRTIPSAVFDIHPVLLLRTWQISRWRLPRQVKPPYAEYKDEDWYDNDGALNTFAMLYPRLPNVHPHSYVGDECIQEGQAMKQGIWYYSIQEADHMSFIINRERSGIRFDVLYDGIFQRCRKHLTKRKAKQSREEMVLHCGCLDICVCNTTSPKV